MCNNIIMPYWAQSPVTNTSLLSSCWIRADSTWNHFLRNQCLEKHEAACLTRQAYSISRIFDWKLQPWLVIPFRFPVGRKGPNFRVSAAFSLCILKLSNSLSKLTNTQTCVPKLCLSDMSIQAGSMQWHKKMPEAETAQEEKLFSRAQQRTIF